MATYLGNNKIKIMLGNQGYSLNILNNIKQESTNTESLLEGADDSLLDNENIKTK